MRGFIEAPTNSGEDGPVLTGTTLTSILPAVRKIYTPVPYFDDLGKYLKIEMGGRISTSATPGTLTLLVKFGSTTVWTSNALATMAASQTNLTWSAEIRLWQTSVAATVTLKGIGTFLCPGLVASNPVLMMPATAPVDGTAFDPTTSQLIDVQAQFSLTGQSLTLHHWNPTWAV